MNTLDLGRASQDRELRDDELGAVSGGTEGYPGLPLGTNINLSPVPAMVTICVLMLSWQSARSQEKDPHWMTALGVISEDVREIYAREVKACYHEAGEAARGPKFLDCLQRHVRSQQDALEKPFMMPGCHTSVHNLQN